MRATCAPCERWLERHHVNDCEVVHLKSNTQVSLRHTLSWHTTEAIQPKEGRALLASPHTACARFHSGWGTVAIKNSCGNIIKPSSILCTDVRQNFHVACSASVRASTQRTLVFGMMQTCPFLHGTATLHDILSLQKRGAEGQCSGSEGHHAAQRFMHKLAAEACGRDATHSMSMPFSNGGTLSRAARLPCSRPYGGPQNPFTPQSCAQASLLESQDDAAGGARRACA